VDSTGETSAQSVQPLDEGNWILGVSEGPGGNAKPMGQPGVR
jgi:hypothetical protein